MVTIADLSKSKQAEAALREGEARLRLAMTRRRWHCGTGNPTRPLNYSEGLAVLFAIRPTVPTDYRVLQEPCTRRTASSSRRRCATR